MSSKGIVDLTEDSPKDLVEISPDNEDAKMPGKSQPKAKPKKSQDQLFADTSEDDDDGVRILGDDDSDDDDEPVRKQNPSAHTNRHGSPKKAAGMARKKGKKGSKHNNGSLFIDTDEEILDDSSVESIASSKDGESPQTKDWKASISSEKKDKPFKSPSSAKSKGRDGYANKPPPGLTDSQKKTWAARNAQYSNGGSHKKRGRPIGSTKEAIAKKKKKQKSGNNGVRILSELRAHNAGVAKEEVSTGVKRQPKKADIYTVEASEAHSHQTDDEIHVPGMEVGSRVYAEFPDDGFYYWGKISKKERKKHSRFHMYEIVFDDGDLGENIPARKNAKTGNSSDKTRCFHRLPIKFGFPIGWSFVFDEQLVGKNRKSVKGFVILAPNSRQYYMAEKAKSHNPTSLAEVDEAGLYDHVGIDPPSLDGWEEHKEKRRAQENQKRRASANQTSKPTIKQPASVKQVRQQPIGMNAQLKTALEEMHLKRCQNCPLCTRSECEACVACMENASERANDEDDAKKLVCYKKFKAQAAPALPQGWRFYFADPKEMPWKLDDVPEGLEGLVLLSPEGKKYASVDKAYKALSVGGHVTSMAKQFYADIGCKVRMKHPLHGRRFRKRWVDVDGKYQVIYGKIVQVLASKDGKHFTVEFDEESRALANDNRAAHRGLVPNQHRICEHFAFGGCLDADKESLPTDITYHYCTWLVPEIRHETMEKYDNGDNFLPKVVVHFRGFQLVITPKESTIPNAGYGVFISCKNLLGTGEDFRLGPGELLDLGVYAPFRSDDVKLKHVFDLKNFLFSNICGEWTFDTVHGEKQLFDITDDATGELHDLAKRHIPAYVNETDGITPPSITAQHDPAGSVHYLLGHYDVYFKELVLKADGVSREVFIDYGENYEDFRVRKNYSRLPKKEAEARNKELLETDHLTEMEALLDLDLEKITQCLIFMQTKWYNPQREYPVTVISRGILALMLLRKRMDVLIKEVGPDPLRRGERAKELGPCAKIQLQRWQANQLLERLYDWWSDCNALKATFLSDKVLESAMEFVLGPDTDLASMPPDVLENKVKGIDDIPEYTYT
ncbi:MAG: hypothetical protein SGILL_003514 [Bacillariaceae sp.]